MKGWRGNTETEKEEVRVCTGKNERERVITEKTKGKACMTFYQKCFSLLALIFKKRIKGS